MLLLLDDDVAVVHGLSITGVVLRAGRATHAVLRQARVTDVVLRGPSVRLALLVLALLGISG